MKFIITSLLVLSSFCTFAVEFEVIGDFRNSDELKNWSIISESGKANAKLIFENKTALFFSEESHQGDQLLKKGNWDFSQYSLFMADLISDGSDYIVRLADEEAVKNGYSCSAVFSSKAGVLETVKVAVKDFNCDSEKPATLDLSNIKEVGISPKGKDSFAVYLESFWMEAPNL